MLHGALARRWRHIGAGHDRRLLGGHSDPDREVSEGGSRQSGPRGHYCHERPLVRARDGRSARADYSRDYGRTPLTGTS